MDLDALLEAVLSSQVDSQTRSSAEAALKALAGNPAHVHDLLQRVAHHASGQHRHLACLLLRKRIGRHWPRLPLEARQATQALLLQRAVAEPEHVVKRAVADLVAAVAKHALPANEWPDLLPGLHQWSQVKGQG